MKTKTYDDVRKLGLDAQDRAHAKHLITCRDKWNQETMDRFTLEMKGKTATNEWSETAKAHADKLNSELEAMLRRAVVAR